MTLPTSDTTSMPLGPGGPDWLVTPGLVAHPAATAFMESRVAAILDGTAPEAVWLVEHPPMYTAGTSARSIHATRVGAGMPSAATWPW